MAKEFQKLSNEFQRTGKGAYGSMVRSAGEYRKSLQGVSLEWAEFSKKSINQAIEAQAQLTKKAFDAYISELSRFATLGLYSPFLAQGGMPEVDDAGQDRRTVRETNATSRATNSRRTSSSRRTPNKKASSGRSRQRTAAQRASTQRKTGPAKARSRKRRK
jgi:hypothetical protein